MNHEPHIFAFLDVDRCLLDTEKAFDIVRDVTDKNTSVSKQMINTAYAEHKRMKKSFNVTGFIESQLGSGEQWEIDILPDFVRRGRREGLLMPYGKEFIARLGELGINYGLLTYGSWSNEADDPGADRERSIKWQLAKIAGDSTLAPIPSLVTHTPKKTEYIIKELTDKTPDGSTKIFLPSEYTDSEDIVNPVDKGILVDDKLVAHQDGDPDLVRGLLVIPETANNRNDHHMATDDITAPNLKQVIGLEQAAEAIETIVTELRSR